MAASRRRDRAAPGLAVLAALALSCSLTTSLDDLSRGTSAGSTTGSSAPGSGGGGAGGSSATAGGAGAGEAGGAGGGPPGGTTLWARSFGDAEDAGAFGVAIDAGGNVAITGYAVGAVDFGSGPLPPGGGVDLVVARFSTDGAPIWSLRGGDDSAQYGNSIAVDTKGDVLVVGSFGGLLTIGRTQLLSAGPMLDVFVAKLDRDSGTTIWAKRFGDTDLQGGLSVAVDALDDVVVGGYFDGIIDFGCGPMTSQGQSDAFVAKLDAKGDCIFSKAFGDPAPQSPTSVGVDSVGSVLVTGAFQGTVDFGGGALTSSGGDDAYVVKLDPKGNHLWSTRFGNALDQVGNTVSADADGNVLLVGEFQGTVALGGGVLTSAGGDDIFAAKFGPGGAHIWSERFGDGDDQYAGGSVGPSGALYLAGAFKSDLDLGGDVLASQGGWDVFVGKLDGLGAHAWSKGAGAVNDQNCYALAAGASGVAIAGEFTGSIDLGTGSLTTAGGTDILVAKFAP